MDFDFISEVKIKLQQLTSWESPTKRLKHIKLTNYFNLKSSRNDLLLEVVIKKTSIVGSHLKPTGNLMSHEIGSNFLEV